jgi:hypothetical protein
MWKNTAKPGRPQMTRMRMRIECIEKCGRVQLKCDGTRLRTGREVKGKLANKVGSKYPSHYLGT